MTQERLTHGLGFEIPPGERTALVEALLRIIAEQRVEIQRLRDELDRVRGLPPRPKRQPSMLGSDQPPTAPPQPKPSTPDGKRPGSAKDHKTHKLQIHQTIPLTPPDLPPGARRISHRDFIVQDLRIETHNIRYRREVHQLPDGSLVTGALPGDVQGHFGSELRCYILYQYYHNHVTEPDLRAELLDRGIVISVGQIDRLLHSGHEALHAEKEALLPAARAVATHFHVDDTSARHRGQNYHTTGIGTEFWSYFQTTPTKSRINFLEILRAPHQDYVLDGDALEYLLHYNLALRWQSRLEQRIAQAGGRIIVSGAAAWEQQLDLWQIHGAEARELVTEAALWGCLMYHELYIEQPIVSDDAGQFKLLGYLQGLCWLHAERNVARVLPLTAAQHRTLERVRGEIWDYYQRLKRYRTAPTPQQKGRLERDFDRLFLQCTGFAELNEALRRMHAKKEELLLVLDYPHLPLENNPEERDLREWAKTRKIHAGTRNDSGRRCRDTFLSLKQTCRKLRLSFWAYLRDRIHGLHQIASLADLILRRRPCPPPTP